eukprot:Ihof_evm5s6 gene=Ihof_evmTU5s6
MDTVTDLARLLFGGVVEDSHTTLALLVTVVVILASSLILFLKFRAARRAKSLLLVGCQGAGKTALFMQLRDGRMGPTFTTQKENQALVRLPGVKKDVPPLHIVDLPGHGRLQREGLDLWANQAGALIFVIDSTEVHTRLLDIAGCLYDTLCHPSLLHRHVPLLLACCKQDVVTALSPRAIREALESEVEKVRKTRTGHVAMDTEGANEEVFLGRSDKVFSFNDLSNPITFKGSKMDDIKDVIDWIREYA